MGNNLVSSQNKRPADYIIFAISQAHEAEAFGFSRNECCRNLKTALHQYWQNKTLGLHGQSQKKLIPRSRAAAGLPMTECIVEHAVPQMQIVNWLMEVDPLTEKVVVQLLHKFYVVMLVTRDEHSRLNSGGVRYTMPEDWDGVNVYARYEVVGIEVENTETNSSLNLGV